MDLTNRVAVITGGARGIGFACAERLLQGGASVSLWDLDGARLARAAAELKPLGAADVRELDLTQEARVSETTAQVVKSLGRIDILINNAGITGGNAPSWELTAEVWRRVIEVNLIAPYLVCRSVVPVMMRQSYGRIVNIASVAGKEGNPNASHYSASKAGLIGFTKSLAKELARHNILVNCVTPAAAKTDIFAQMTPAHIEFMLSKIPMQRFVEPREIAAMVCWLASEECSFSTGGVFDISGGRATY
ncbi:MAG: SDR family NAD(P)-dependent oxidoreductase [Steroidobacteraceae bacterium]